MSPGTVRTTLAAVRLATTAYAGLYLIVRSNVLFDDAGRPDDRFEPVGVVALVLDRPLPASVAGGLVAVALVAWVPAVLGWRWRVSGPLFALLVLWILTYRHSWGSVLHTENLLVIHLLVLSVSPATDRWSVDAMRRPSVSASRPAAGGASEWTAGWALRALMAATVLTYLVAGIAKVRNGGWDWVTGDVLRSQVAYDNLRKHLLGDVHSPLGGWLTGTAWVWPPMALATQVVELGGVLAVFGTRLRLVWVGLAWSFHVAIAVLMAIVFPYHLLGLAFLPLLPLGRWFADRSPPVPARSGAVSR